ncbi:hypothetical protein UFOVP695_29 [uncultured Caudovirales phage]|uniref:Uncharacterized protein n=1 Tax=uncultured Caudovirales phage TaxID=2100421 RepID=A0A6J5NEK4_9CAUD|nr:hypothetical protein UFOVP695_29 [uncultured Caudovirales phage]
MITYEIRKYNNGLRFIKSNKGIGTYILDDLIILSKQYKYIYRATTPYIEITIDKHYSGFILCEIDMKPIINMFIWLNVFRYINSIDNCISLYNIKEKIEII